MSFDDFKALLEKTEEQSSSPYDGKQLIGIILLVIVLAGGGFLYYRQSRAVPVKKDVFQIEEERPAVAKSEPSSKKGLIVHVCGAVNQGGVFRLKEGDRIVDAIERAGGPAAEADLNILNLAAKLADGAKVYVPKQGEQVPAQQSLTGAQNGGNLADQSPPVNINNATAEQLETLPGVGEVLAQRIMEYRADKGPFSSVEQLRNVEGIGPKKFEQIKEKATVD